VSVESAFKLLLELEMTEIEAACLKLLIFDPRFGGNENVEGMITKEELLRMLQFIRENVPKEKLEGPPFGSN
jgi:hypothetical protein